MIFLFWAIRYRLIDDGFNWLVVFTGKHILHLSDITILPNGSGDTTWNYVQLFIFFLFAFTGCVIWSLADRGRKNYNRWLYWLTVGVRYYLAYSMLVYGSIKVFKLQFPSPSPARLLEPYGQSSPMRLAWTFLGYSKAYNSFMGSAEVMAGLLLLFRKTTAFGALLAMIVTSNIVAINFCFDVPVKLYSSTLLLMAIFIIAPEISRIYLFFFSRRTVSLKAHAFMFQTKWKRITACAVKAAFILYLLIYLTTDAVSQLEEYGDDSLRPKLYGDYNVVVFAKHKDTITPLLTDTARWKKLAFGYSDRIGVIMMNDTLKGYAYVNDTLKQKLTMTSQSDTMQKYRFDYKMFPHDTVEFASNDSTGLYLKLSRIDEKNFLLMQRGFHWINEYPFNK